MRRLHEESFTLLHANYSQDGPHDASPRTHSELAQMRDHSPIISPPRGSGLPYVPLAHQSLVTPLGPPLDRLQQYVVEQKVYAKSSCENSNFCYSNPSVLLSVLVSTTRPPPPPPLTPLAIPAAPPSSYVSHPSPTSTSPRPPPHPTTSLFQYIKS